MRSIVEVQLKFRNPINTMKDGDWQWDAGIPKDAHSIQIRSHQIDRRNVSCQTVLARPELHYERRINRGVHARLAYNYGLAGSIIDKSRLLWLMIVLSRGSGHCVYNITQCTPFWGICRVILQWTYLPCDKARNREFQ